MYDKPTLVFQLEEVCGINVVVHKMKNIYRAEYKSHVSRSIQ